MVVRTYGVLGVACLALRASSIEAVRQTMIPTRTSSATPLDITVSCVNRS